MASPGNSSSSSTKSTKSCAKCRVRMSIKSFDTHTLCFECRGISCQFNERCDTCVDWDDERMSLYIAHENKLAKKREYKLKSKEKSLSEPQGKPHDLSNSIQQIEDFSDLASSAESLEHTRKIQSIVQNYFAKFENNFTSTFDNHVNSHIDKKLGVLSSNLTDTFNNKFQVILHALSDKQNSPSQNRDDQRDTLNFSSRTSHLPPDSARIRNDELNQKMEDEVDHHGFSHKQSDVAKLEDLVRSGYLTSHESDYILGRMEDLQYQPVPNETPGPSHVDPKRPVPHASSQNKGSVPKPPSPNKGAVPKKKGKLLKPKLTTTKREVQGVVPKTKPHSQTPKTVNKPEKTPDPNLQTPLTKTTLKGIHKVPSPSIPRPPSRNDHSSPLRPQKSPESPQKSPEFPQKSPEHQHEPPTSPHSTPNSPASTQSSSEDEDSDQEEDETISPAEFKDLAEKVFSLFPHARYEIETELPPNFISIKGREEKNKVYNNKFTLYDQARIIKNQIKNKVKNIIKTKKRPHTVLPKRKKIYQVLGDERVTRKSTCNDLFSNITSTRPKIPGSSALVPIDTLRRLEESQGNLQEILSFSMWLLSAHFSMLHLQGVHLEEPELHERILRSLSTALEDATRLGFAQSALVNFCHKIHFLQFTAPSITQGQKDRLLGSDPFDENLFDPEILKEITKEFEGTEATSSHINISKALSRGYSPFYKRKREDFYQRQLPVGRGSLLPSPSNFKSPFSLLGAPPKRGKGFDRGGRGRGRGDPKPRPSPNPNQKKNFP